ncbi:FkbM family methyltransferase [Herbaspirillum rhizosphaerae]|uniref:FkbM family methyltransferase n=1 Tax=Herbaspirillum rhizosphaerae TaxID=346179 RepID=UPI00067C265C|nr:FkbM family methyltransferase [Herbaspirillum rhizosphaerae]
MPALKKIKTWLFKFRMRVTDGYALSSYSQEGEDMVLRRIFEGKSSGFYVDVGAHHPARFSNTNFFYRRGWRGINIEPNPDVVAIFRRDRKRDINLQLGVSDRPQMLKYHFFNDPALNSFDEELVAQRLANTPYKVIGSADVPVQRLDAILNQHLPAGTAIDFLTIDVEGLDFLVLQSNDWTRYRPVCVLVEALGTSMEDVAGSEIYEFMKSQGYLLFAKTYNTWIFRTPDSVS